MLPAPFDPTSATWRRLRAGLFAVVAALLAALGHLVGGGALPDLAALLTATAVVAPVAGGLARRQRGYPAILGVLALSQGLFHLLFGLTGHGGHAMPMAGALSGPLPDPMSARMLALHLVSAALTALVLTRGEAAVFRLSAVLRRLVRRSVTVLLPTIAGPQRPPRRPTRAHRGTGHPVVRHPRRGPPLLPAF